MIPMYSAEWPGRRLRDYSLKAVLAYERLGAIVVRRDGAGRVKSARFLRVVHRLPEGSVWRPGVRHTHVERVGEHRIVQHNPLPYAALNGDLEAEEREAIMRASFQAVILSVK
jgi:hypothetical protein